MSVHAEPPPPVVSEAHGIKYMTGPQLGKGGFAICHRADLIENNKSTGRAVALKIVRSKMEPPKLAQKVGPRRPLQREHGLGVCVLIREVRHRAATALEAAPPQHRRVLPSLLVRDEHLCCA